MALTLRLLKDLIVHPRHTWLSHRQLRELPPDLVGGIGAGNYRESGEELVQLLCDEGLTSRDRVLDLGCGLGRVAIPLQRILGSGSYDGMDVVSEMILWDCRHISSVSPQFRFHHLDVYNGRYNPEGRLGVADFRLPFEDETFDFALATSLFTHLLEAETLAYFEELSRVLRVGGRLLATFFLLDETSLQSMSEGKSTPAFAYPWERGLVDNPTGPEDAVAFDFDWIEEQLRAVGLEPRLPHYRGYWSGRPTTVEDRAGHRFQDHLVIRKV